MPQFQIEIDDKGDFIGQLPTEVDAILKRIEATSHGKGFGAGAAKAAEEAKKQIEDTVAARVREMEARQPLERERFEGIEKENGTLKSRIDDMVRTHERTLRSREEQHAEELNKRVDSLRKRDGKIIELVGGQVRGLAIAAGARDESLDEIQIIIGHQIGFDDDMAPFIKSSDGSPLQQHGKPVSLESFVKSYIESHPHHRKTTQQRSGQPGRGASFQQGGKETASLEAATNRVQGGDRSASAINDLFLAGRKKAS